MTNRITTKDYWYVSIISLFLYFIFKDYFFFLVGLLLAIVYFIERKNERKKEELFIELGKVASDLEKLDRDKK